MMAVAGWATPTISSTLYPYFHINLYVLIIFSLFVTTARTIPIDYFPLNSQLPPVARVGEPFIFSFAPQTFSSPLEMTYRLGDGAPAWLSLDSKSRTLSGTPGKDDVPPSDEDVVGVPISLIAQDSTGEASTNATLVVSRNPTPRVAIPLSEQIPNLGPYSAPASLLLYPSRKFNFSFSRDTFRVDDGYGDSNHEDGDERRSKLKPKQQKRKDQALNYYAVSGDNAPLPSWIQFDSSSLTFSGETPPFESLVQPPQTFTFQLVASDVIGFASAAIPFSVVVGNHELTVATPVVKLNATRGKPFEYADLPKVLRIDERPLQRTDVSSVNATGLPRWLEFDEEKTWKLSGTPDPRAEPVNVTIAVVDNFADTLNLTLEIDVDVVLFVADLPDLNVTAGEDFSFDIGKVLIEPSDTRVVFQSDPDEPWIHLNSSTLVLSGTAPRTLSEDVVNGVRVKLKATSKSTEHTETKNMNINILTPKPAKPSPTSDPKADDDASRRNLLWLLIIPILLVCIAAIALLFYVRRRGQGPRKLDTKDVSAPIPGSFVFNGPSSLTESSMRNIRRMMDTGPAPTGGRFSAQKGVSGNIIETPSNATSSETASDPSANGDLPPHALTMHSGASKPQQMGNVKEAKRSWIANQTSRMSKSIVKAGTMDEMSLLSDTSLGEAESHITDAQSSDISRKTGNEAFRGAIGLEIPLIAEPFSIQPTPELAYRAAGKYDMSSDDEAPPPIGYVKRRRSDRQQDAGLGLRSVGSRLSKAIKRISASKHQDVKRHSSGSTSTSQTTRTSILTSGVAEEATMSTATNVIERPTVIHIPSRPGEVRRVSRRTNETTPLFGGRSLTKSQRNFGLAGDESPAIATEESFNLTPTSTGLATTTRDCNTSWDRMARNSLGIAYNDLLGAGPETRRPFVQQKEPMMTTSQSESWRIQHTSQELMSPDHWPVPNAFMGIAITSDAVRSRSEPPQLPPLASAAPSKGPTAPEEKGRDSGSYSVKTHTPTARSRHKRRSSRDERLRDQRVQDELHAMMSQTPSPSHEWRPAHTRALPETLPRASRAPLTDRSNGMYTSSENRGMGLRSAPSRRSQRTARSAKSVRSVWVGEDEDDDDAWEDVRPPESMIGGWEGDSQGSFSVYI
ncbi:hypothetical protein F5X96DRAFT_342887 [Biscogniauxia mediterranea]|nr:hypothetical protein F5X96DRAFT_342887 [Biscogniauxia mediterranea]